MNNDISIKMVELEYLDEHRVHVIHINDITRQAVDDYVDIIDREIVQYEGHILLSVHNFAKISGMLSPYFMGRLKQFSGDKMRTDLIGRVAIVSPSDVFRLLMNPIVKLFSRGNTTLDIQFFSSVDEAIEWVSDFKE